MAKRLTIDQAEFLRVFARDVDFHDAYPRQGYLDRQTGDVPLIYDNDDDAKLEVGLAAASDDARTRESIRTAPDRFILVPGMSHGQHHDLLKEFLESEQIPDSELRESAAEAYHASIGRWLKDV